MRPPIKCHGGKYFLKQWIIDKFPNNYETMVYGEPFIGGGNVFLNKNRSRHEVINDADPRVFSVWFQLRNNYTEFVKRLSNVSYSKKNFEMAKLVQEKLINENDFLNLAISEYILRHMSRGADRKSFGSSSRLRGGKPEYINAWLSSTINLQHIAKRLCEVDVKCDSAINIMLKYDSPNTFYYLDPPYLHNTRVTTNNYEYEMDESEHGILLETIKGLKAKVLISGYWSKLYEDSLRGWSVFKKEIINHSSQKKSKPLRTEILWANY